MIEPFLRMWILMNGMCAVYSVGLVKLTRAWRLMEVLLVLKTFNSPTLGFKLLKLPPGEIAAISSASVRSI